MKRKPYIVVVYNEPTVMTKEGRKYISEAGLINEEGSLLPKSTTDVIVDTSEVGVLQEREDVTRALASLGYRSNSFNVDGDVLRLMKFLRDEEPDLIFNLCESFGSESIHEMHVAGIFELLGIPYTGAPPLTLGTALNKVRTKEILMHHGLPTPRFQICKTPTRIAVEDYLDFPLIVKPSREDASVGIETASVVSSLAELRRRVRYIIEQFDQPALVEEYIDGRELNVAVMGNQKPITMPISEIDMSTLPKDYHRVISYNAKWMKGTDEYEHTKGVCPARIPAALENRLKEMALKAFALLGCRDYARIDFRLSKENKPYILEVNPNPDICDDAGFARSAKAYGHTFESMIGAIVDYALERNP
jgi:D-alanine-D-alanine ligase